MRQSSSIVFVEGTDERLDFVEFDIAIEVFVGVRILFDRVELFDVVTIVARQWQREITKATKLSREN